LKALLYSACFYCLAFCFCSCNVYRQNILFRTNDYKVEEGLKAAVLEAEANYVIQKNDYLSIDVFTNKGERIIDPNMELMQQGAQLRQIVKPEYLVHNDGVVNLPIVGIVKLEGKTLFQAGKFLEDLYNEYYRDAYVLINFINKRVIVLGAPGGQVIPLANENMNLVEVLALAGGVDNNAKAGNIRLIRGDLDNPRIFVIDLTTVQGIKNYNLKVEPGDIIYIEPIRRVVTEAVRDVAPILSILTSLLTLIFVVQRID
jgi:polysaccharide biosynthesis/export protein